MYVCIMRHSVLETVSLYSRLSGQLQMEIVSALRKQAFERLYNKETTLYTSRSAGFFTESHFSLSESAYNLVYVLVVKWVSLWGRRKCFPSFAMMLPFGGYEVT